MTKPNNTTKNKIQCAIWWECWRWWIAHPKKRMYNIRRIHKKKPTMKIWTWFEEVGSLVIQPMPENYDDVIIRNFDKRIEIK